MITQLRPILKYRLWMTVWSWTPSAAYDLWPSPTKSAEVAVYYRGTSKRLFFRLKRTQRIEMPFVCYGTRTLTQGQLQSIDTREKFSGQELVLTFSGRPFRNRWVSMLRCFPLPPMSCWTTRIWMMSSQMEITAISWWSLKKRPQRLFKTTGTWNGIMCPQVKTRASKEAEVPSPKSWEGYGLRDQTG